MLGPWRGREGRLRRLDRVRQKWRVMRRRMAVACALALGFLPAARSALAQRLARFHMGAKEAV